MQTATSAAAAWARNIQIGTPWTWTASYKDKLRRCNTCLCVSIKVINDQKKDVVCLRVALRAAWRGPVDCGKVWRNIYWELSSWRGKPNVTWFGVKGVWSLAESKLEEPACLHAHTFFYMNHNTNSNTKICDSLCVASDPEVTDGARHSFSGHKQFTQKELLPGLVLMKRSTKRRSCYRSFIGLVQMSQTAPPSSVSPDYSSHTWSTINISPALFTNTFLHFQIHKHTCLVPCFCRF